MAKSKKSLHPAPDDPAFVLDAYPLYALNRASAVYVEEMSKALKTIGMDQPRWRVLTLLDDTNPSTVSDISRRTITKLSTITRILIRMEADGLVRRAQSAGDSRVTEVYITTAGRQAVDQVKKVGGRIYRKAIKGLNEDDLTRLMRILKVIEGNLGRSPYLD